MPTKNQKVHQRGRFELLEMYADTGTIKPGMLLEATATGCKAHATSVGFAELLFAQEDALQGTTIDDAYTISTPVRIAAEHRGSVTMARLKAGTNYTIGMQLFSAGDGTLRATTGTPKQLIATVAYAAVDLSASGAVDTLAQVRVA